MYNAIPVFLYWFEIKNPSSSEDQQEEALECGTPASGHLNSNIHIPDIENNSIYLQLLKKELQLNNAKFEKKVWTQSEVQLLIQLREKGLGWEQISRKIQGANAQVCKRRFQRFKNEKVKWSSEIDHRVKVLCQVEKMAWKQIYVILRQQYGISDRKKLRQLKERYRLHLRSEICRTSWTVEQDLELLSYVEQLGRKWKQISKMSHYRTQLQLKNRFYGTLLPIQQRVLRQLESTAEN